MFTIGGIAVLSTIFGASRRTETRGAGELSPHTRLICFGTVAGVVCLALGVLLLTSGFEAGHWCCSIDDAGVFDGTTAAMVTAAKCELAHMGLSAVFRSLHCSGCLSADKNSTALCDSPSFGNATSKGITSADSTRLP